MPGVTSLSEDKLLKRSRYGMIRKNGAANIKKFVRIRMCRCSNDVNNGNLNNNNGTCAV